MIIDCHGHYTTAPDPHQDYRAAQLARLENPSLPEPQSAVISDDQIRESIELNQLKLLRERGADMTIFSPRASTMAHHVGDEQVSQAWTIACNDLIKRVVELFPEQFIGVCQLPQSPGVPVKNSIAELERCVTQLGFVGCNLNPDPSGGHWTAPPLTDRHWYPFLRKWLSLMCLLWCMCRAHVMPASMPLARIILMLIPLRLCNFYKAICSLIFRICALLSRMVVVPYPTIGGVIADWLIC